MNRQSKMIEIVEGKRQRQQALKEETQRHQEIIRKDMIGFIYCYIILMTA
jgi:hypothetical protein